MKMAWSAIFFWAFCALICSAIATGCVRSLKTSAATQRGHVVLDAASTVLVETHAVYYERCESERPRRAPKNCTRLADALDAARESVLAARRALDSVDAHNRANAGATVTCAVAAVGRVLELGKKISAGPSPAALEMWAQYASTIGQNLCSAGDPNASLGRGGA